MEKWFNRVATYDLTLDPIVINKKNSTTIEGTADARISKVQLRVNGRLLENIQVVDGKYSFSRKYVTKVAGDKKLFAAGDIVKIEVVDKDKSALSVEKLATNAENSGVTIDEIDLVNYIIKGTTDDSVTSVSLSVNGRVLVNAPVTDGDFSIERKLVYDTDGTRRVLKAGDVILIRNQSNLKTLYMEKIVE